MRHSGHGVPFPIWGRYLLEPTSPGSGEQTAGSADVLTCME